MPPSCIVVFVAVALAPLPAFGKSLVVNQRKTSLRSKVNTTAFQSELRDAMSEALGCGGQVDDDHMKILELQLFQLWKTLPKNTHGRIERRSLRYLVHRHFNKKSALMIRGFEPSRSVSESGWGSVDILSKTVPAYVESVLQSQHAEEHGFDLRDAAYVVATLEQLMFDSESSLLMKSYDAEKTPVSHSLSRERLAHVVQTYLVHWLMGGDQESVDILLNNRSLLFQVFPHWDKLVDFAKGEVKAMEFRRQKRPRDFSQKGHHALSSTYDFDDAHEVVGGITKSFASFWESECASMKESLMQMDAHHTGRVPLSQFYGTGLDTEWRFGESESYLRELGALDESSAWRGKQVIIPNYIQGASNCIVSTSHYLVCCINDCTTLLGEIEAQVGAPTASVTNLLSLVGNMTSTSQTTLDEQMPAGITGSLAKQLHQIAASSGGSVPLHGRLFAQWLHYAFPRECAFPHKTGTASVATPFEYGDGYIATKDQMQEHASAADVLDKTNIVEKGSAEWMSQWSEEEELVADHVGEKMRAPWEQSYLPTIGGILIILGMFGTFGLGRKGAGGSGTFLPTYDKAHFV